MLLAMLLGSIFGIFFLYVSAWFSIPFFSVVFGTYFALKRIVCPNCGVSVLYKGSLMGMTIEAGFIRKRCQKCGYDLTGNH